MKWGGWVGSSPEVKLGIKTTENTPYIFFISFSLTLSSSPIAEFVDWTWVLEVGSETPAARFSA